MQLGPKLVTGGDLAERIAVGGWISSQKFDGIGQRSQAASAKLQGDEVCEPYNSQAQTRIGERALDRLAAMAMAPMTANGIASSVRAAPTLNARSMVFSALASIAFWRRILRHP